MVLLKYFCTRAHLLSFSNFNSFYDRLSLDWYLNFWIFELRFEMCLWSITAIWEEHRLVPGVMLCLNHTQGDILTFCEWDFRKLIIFCIIVCHGEYFNSFDKY